MTACCFAVLSDPRMTVDVENKCLSQGRLRLLVRTQVRLSLGDDDDDDGGTCG